MAALRVALDATPLLGPRSGIGWFVAELLDRLAASAAGNDLDLLAFGVTLRGRSDLAPLLPPGVRCVKRPMAARPLREAWRRSDLPPIEWWTGPLDVVHGTNFVVPPARRAARVVTVHDLAAWRFPHLVDRASLDFPRLVGRAVRRGAWVHTNSHYVAEEVCEVLGAERERVVVVAPGIPEVAEVDAAAGRYAAGTDRYVLALGTVEPRKDLPTLVAAFDRAELDDDVRLVVAGSDGWGSAAFDAALVAARRRDRVVRLGYVTASLRAALLRGASVLAYPSVYEGFGFPPLEAMSVGVPVVASRAGSLPEVCADAALSVDAGDVDALAAALGRLMGDDALRADLVSRGFERVGDFDWHRSASQMAGLYRRAGASKGAP